MRLVLQPQKLQMAESFYLCMDGPNKHQRKMGQTHAVNLSGYVSITPMRADLTAHDQLATLAKKLK